MRAVLRVPACALLLRRTLCTQPLKAGEWRVDEKTGRIIGLAAEVISGAKSAPVVLVGEHASTRLPPPWKWNDETGKIGQSRYASDVGSSTLASTLAENTNWPTVLGRFSRLVYDLSFPEGEVPQPPADISGVLLDFNQGVDAEEFERRRVELCDPFYEMTQAVASGVDNCKALVSIRSHFVRPSASQADAIIFHTSSPHSRNASQAIAAYMTEWGYTVDVEAAEVSSLPCNLSRLEAIAGPLNAEVVAISPRADYVLESMWLGAFEEVTRVAIHEAFTED